MKKKPIRFKFKKLFLGLSLATLLASCASFQGSSYFASDGIYVSPSNIGLEKSKAITKNNYYEQYFKEAANNGYVETTDNEIYFTDINSYSSSVENIEDVALENDNSQIPWGGETSQTEIILLNNFPNYSWGLASFGFSYSPFWNNYYFDPYRFGYGGFYSPFRNYPYWNPFRRYAGMWRGFNSFYSPFSYYGGFYNPYGFGFRSGYRNSWANQWNRFGDYYGNNSNQRNKRDYSSTIARIKSGRGEKNYNSPKERSRETTQSADSRERDVQNKLNRINLGRGVSSLGRNLVIGYDRNRLGINTKSLNNSRSIRPLGTINSFSRDLRQTPLNTNIVKSPQGLSRGSGGDQTQYRLVERNPARSSTRVQRRISSLLVDSPGNSRNSRSSRRVVRQSNQNKNKSISNYRSQRSNSYSRSNNSYSNNRSSTRSYNSGGGGSLGRSSGSSGNRGRTN